MKDMFLQYERYRDTYHGRVSQQDFTSLESAAEMILEGYIHDLVSRDQIKPLEEYGLDLERLLVLQIDFIDSVGGISAINGGNSSLDVTSVETSGFKYGFGDTQNRSGGREELKYNGLPFSPLVESNLYHQLRKRGYTKLKVRQY